MSEATNPQGINLAEIVAVLESREVNVAVNQTDPTLLDQTTQALRVQLSQYAEQGYHATPGMLGDALLPVRTDQEGEPFGIVVSSGVGRLDVVAGNDASQHDIQPGSIVLIKGDPSAREATWIRATSNDGEAPIGATFLQSDTTAAMLRGEAEDAHHLGAKGRRLQGERLAGIAEQKLRVLGRLANQ
jgi:hypothetical protein